MPRRARGAHPPASRSCALGEDGDSKRNMPAIGLPSGRFTETDFRIVGQETVADSPTQHLSPVEDYLVVGSFRDLLRRDGARQDPQNHLGCLNAMCGGAVKASPYDPAADVLIEKAIDRHACRSGNPFNDLVCNKGLAYAILKQCREEDDVLGGQLRKLHANLVQREF